MPGHIATLPSGHESEDSDTRKVIPDLILFCLPGWPLVERASGLVKPAREVARSKSRVGARSWRTAPDSSRRWKAVSTRAVGA
jgi:hypothetical protein